MKVIKFLDQSLQSKKLRSCFSWNYQLSQAFFSIRFHRDTGTWHISLPFFSEENSSPSTGINASDIGSRVLRTGHGKDFINSRKISSYLLRKAAGLSSSCALLCEVSFHKIGLITTKILVEPTKCATYPQARHGPWFDKFWAFSLPHRKEMTSCLCDKMEDWSPRGDRRHLRSVVNNWLGWNRSPPPTVQDSGAGRGRRCTWAAPEPGQAQAGGQASAKIRVWESIC